MKTSWWNGQHSRPIAKIYNHKLQPYSLPVSKQEDVAFYYVFTTYHFLRLRCNNATPLNIYIYIDNKNPGMGHSHSQSLLPLYRQNHAHSFHMLVVLLLPKRCKRQWLAPCAVVGHQKWQLETPWFEYGGG